MGEAILVKAGGGSSNGGYIPKTEIITNNYSFQVPKAKKQNFLIRIFGGGGGINTHYWCQAYAGGGGGNMNYAVLTLNENDIIPIIIGAAGTVSYNPTNGGTTSFGSYLSATGGEVSNYGNGGNGGTGGGGAGGSGGTGRQGNGGKGYYGGGGGFSGQSISSKENTAYYGGNGGTYGGGGGGATFGISIGGWGNGGNNTINATNGLNTIGMGLEFEGFGISYNDKYSGGGGYGGNGGRSNMNTYYTGGGGGGYGADGGNAYTSAGGGGGGWGGKGGDGSAYNHGGYGGGYGASEYGRGGDYNTQPMPGICIISYMQPIQN